MEFAFKVNLSLNQEILMGYKDIMYKKCLTCEKTVVNMINKSRVIDSASIPVKFKLGPA